MLKLNKAQRYNSVTQLLKNKKTKNKKQHRYYILIDRMYRLTHSYVFVFGVCKFKHPPMTPF